jgi:hypothetical protein
MWQALTGQTLAWVCALVGTSCATLPDITVIQAAYEREASSGSSLHDKELKVLKARCHDNSTDRFLCEVMFVSVTDPTERLYFDIVDVARTASGWELKSGLCKR